MPACRTYHALSRLEAPCDNCLLLGCDYRHATSSTASQLGGAHRLRHHEKEFVLQRRNFEAESITHALRQRRTTTLRAELPTAIRYNQRTSKRREAGSSWESNGGIRAKAGVCTLAEVAI